ncbi:MAG: bifunctional pyr operon transcriptional regulator/uracil phosphoribosyltransferase PyrR, partial [Flavisolibacter sp.]
MKSLLNEQQIQLTVRRLANQVLENNVDLKNTVLIGLQPRGIFLSDRIVKELSALTSKIFYGKLDITFYRDDIRKELHVPNQTDIKF